MSAQYSFGDNILHIAANFKSNISLEQLDIKLRTVSEVQFRNKQFQSNILLKCVDGVADVNIFTFPIIVLNNCSIDLVDKQFLEENYQQHYSGKVLSYVSYETFHEYNEFVKITLAKCFPPPNLKFVEGSINLQQLIIMDSSFIDSLQPLHGLQLKVLHMENISHDFSLIPLITSRQSLQDLKLVNKATLLADIFVIQRLDTLKNVVIGRIPRWDYIVRAAALISVLVLDQDDIGCLDSDILRFQMPHIYSLRLNLRQVNLRHVKKVLCSKFFEICEIGGSKFASLLNESFDILNTKRLKATVQIPIVFVGGKYWKIDV